MKKIFFVLFAVVLTHYASAQQLPVRWNYSVKKLNATKYELHITARIDDGWHIYAQKQPENAVAQPTKIKFIQNPLIKASGDVEEIGQLEKHRVETLGIEQYQYSNKVDFVQVVELKNQVKTSISGSVTFQVCTERLCLPPKEEAFNLAL